jgi:hypothetical protein
VLLQKEGPSNAMPVSPAKTIITQVLLLALLQVRRRRWRSLSSGKAVELDY